MTVRKVCPRQGPSEMRRICRIIVWSLMALFPGGSSPAETVCESRPNILILMADNWAWPHASALGDPVVQTPTFDRLAASGVVFRHAFCSVPSCAPARAVFLTGRHAHRLGPAANLHGTFPTSTTPGRGFPWSSRGRGSSSQAGGLMLSLALRTFSPRFSNWRVWGSFLPTTGRVCCRYCAIRRREGESMCF